MTDNCRECVAIILVCLFLLFACDKDDDKDDGDEVDVPAGWTDDGCEYGRNLDSELKAGASSDDPYDDCIPELPSNIERDRLVTLLDAYLGGWVDIQDNQRIVTCRPEGFWEVPHYDANAACGYYWRAPIWVEFAESGELYAGEIVEDDAPLNPTLNGRLYYDNGAALIRGERSIDDEGIMRIYFTASVDNDVWSRP
ncbi:MAG TPA: hypothetical protein PK961_10860 [bacterium]|nr:hypothetical protein [bacterium]